MIVVNNALSAYSDLQDTEIFFTSPIPCKSAMEIMLPFPAEHDLNSWEISWSLMERSQKLMPAIFPTKLKSALKLKLRSALKLSSSVHR